MSRYIEADKVLKELRLNHNDVIYIDKRDTAKRIEKIKGIDIVRCKECVHYISCPTMSHDHCNHILNPHSTNADDFCSYGEREESK